MVQVLKRTKYLELFGGATLARLAEVTESSKDEVILGRCATCRPATAIVRLTIQQE